MEGEERGGGAAELGLWAGGEGLCISWAGGCLARSGVCGAGGAGLDLWSGAGSGGLQDHGWGAQGRALQLSGCGGVQSCHVPTCPGGHRDCPHTALLSLSPTALPHETAPILPEGQKLPMEQGRSQPSPLLQVLRVLAGKVVVGHAIHNDFKALHYSHPKALTRDTSKIPLLNRRGGFPENVSISLKRLTKALLNQDIQVPWLEPPRTWGPPLPCQGDRGE